MNKITKKLAVYEYTSWGSCGSFMAGVQIVRDNDTNNNDLIRVSEWNDVEFDAIPVEEVMPEILASLQREEDEENTKHNLNILNIQRKRQEILAITLQPSIKQDREINVYFENGSYRAYYEDTPSSIDQNYKEGCGMTDLEAIDDLKAQDEN